MELLDRKFEIEQQIETLLAQVRTLREEYRLVIKELKVDSMPEDFGDAETVECDD